MGVPLVVKTSLILTGMLGLRLEGFNNGNGSSSVIETSVPFNLQQGVQSDQPITIDMTSINRIPKELREPTASVIEPRADKSESIILQLTDAKAPSKLTVQCGPGVCTNDEICVTWIKADSMSTSSRKSRESPMMIHECLSNDGTHYNKMDPSSMKLCEKEEVHKIIPEPQPCLRETPPCPLVWKYRCDKPSDQSQAHSCKLKSCPGESECTEHISCNLEPPCFVQAWCVKEGEVVA